MYKVTAAAGAAAALLLLLVSPATTAFQTSAIRQACRYSMSPREPTMLASTKERSTGVSEISNQMRDMQAMMEEDEDASLIMQALRGRNINDDDAQVKGLDMKVLLIVMPSINSYSRSHVFNTNHDR